MTKKKTTVKPRYSDADIKAYYMGVGFVMGMGHGYGYKAVLKGLPKELHDSFKNGVNAALSLPSSRFLHKK